VAPPLRAAPESPRSPGTRPSVPAMSDGLNGQAYVQPGENDQYGYYEAASTVSFPKDNQSEDRIPISSPVNGEHTRKTSNSLFSLGKKKKELR
jgi:hypothetical protein